LERDRDYLWAEAREPFQAGDTWWLDNQALTQSAAEEVAERHEPDPWDNIITEWLKTPTERLDAFGNPVTAMSSTPDFVTVPDIMAHCIGKEPKAWTQPDQNRVSHSLTARGWKRYQKRIAGQRIWGYILSPVSPVRP
jgi:predicted P-loop ATPase